MKYKKIIKEIKETYENHESLDDLVDELSNDYVADVVRALCSEKYQENRTLATKLLKKVIKNEKDNVDMLVEYANIIAGEDGLNDLEWARTVFETAYKIAGEDDFSTLADDYRMLANAIANEEGLNDLEWARTVFETAYENAEDCNAYYNLAIALADEEGLNDLEWSKKAYTDAYKLADSFDDYQSLLVKIKNNDFLNDLEWTEDLKDKAIEAVEYSGDWVYLADLFEDDKKLCLELCEKALNSASDVAEACKIGMFYFDSLNNELLAKESYSKAISLIDTADDKDDLLNFYMSDLPNTSWVNELREKIDTI